MLKILQPLEVRHCDTTDVGKQVGNSNDALLLHDLVTTVSGGSIGTLNDNLALKVWCSVLVDDTISSTW